MPKSGSGGGGRSDGRDPAGARTRRAVHVLRLAQTRAGARPLADQRRAVHPAISRLLLRDAARAGAEPGHRPDLDLWLSGGGPVLRPQWLAAGRPGAADARGTPGWLLRDLLAAPLAAHSAAVLLRIGRGAARSGGGRQHADLR